MEGNIVQIELLKKELEYISKRIYERGLTQARGGNISVRVPGTDNVLIKRTSVSLAEVCREDAVLVIHTKIYTSMRNMTLILFIQMLLSYEIIVSHKKKTSLRRYLPTQKLTITLKIDSLHKPVSSVLLFNSQAHP